MVPWMLMPFTCVSDLGAIWGNGTRCKKMICMKRTPSDLCPIGKKQTVGWRITCADFWGWHNNWRTTVNLPANFLLKFAEAGDQKFCAPNGLKGIYWYGFWRVSVFRNGRKHHLFRVCFPHSDDGLLWFDLELGTSWSKGQVFLKPKIFAPVGWN